MPSDAFVIVMAALLGAMVGSFLNVCIVRLPKDQSILRPPSHCPKCAAAVAWYDNVPILSWLVLAIWVATLFLRPRPIGKQARRNKSEVKGDYKWPQIDLALMFIAALTIYMAIRSRRFSSQCLQRGI